ncbi:sigma factor-like helix-turn-helix DNA-binding protein [Oceanobacillus halotolerans]|uniref:sigma factor-like helix-turn-helix DNA-binding protein n=1 Tax=Oceanobacillus halotolerans TaxID=2663380 RepID=UPI00384CAD4D
MWTELQSQLTKNQWKWVDSFIRQNLSIKEIANQEGVSIDAVKSWGRQARKKLQQDHFKEKLLVLNG